MPRPSWRCALCHAAPPDVERASRYSPICSDCAASLDVRGLAWCWAKGHRVKQSEISRSNPYRCAVCHAAYKQAYDATEARRVARREYQRQWRAALDAEDVRAQRRAWRQAWRRRNPEKVAAQRKRRYARHREREIAYVRQWRAHHRAHVRDYARMQRQRNKLRILQSWRAA